MPDQISPEDLHKSERLTTGWGGEPVPNAFDRGAGGDDGATNDTRGYRMKENKAATKNASASTIREV